MASFKWQKWLYPLKHAVLDKLKDAQALRPLSLGCGGQGPESKMNIA